MPCEGRQAPRLRGAPRSGATARARAVLDRLVSAPGSGPVLPGLAFQGTPVRSWRDRRTNTRRSSGALETGCRHPRPSNRVSTRLSGVGSASASARRARFCGRARARRTPRSGRIRCPCRPSTRSGWSRPVPPRRFGPASSSRPGPGATVGRGLAPCAHGTRVRERRRSGVSLRRAYRPRPKRQAVHRQHPLSLALGRVGVESVVVRGRRRAHHVEPPAPSP